MLRVLRAALPEPLLDFKYVPLIRTVLGDTGGSCMARRRSGSTVPSRHSPVSQSTFSSPLRQLHALDQLRAMVRALEDRRRFHPMRSLRPAAALRRSSRRLLVSQSPTSNLAGRFPPTGLSFAAPRKVAVCVRRKTRREVIFAMRKRGKGAASRKRRRNGFSQIGC